MSHRSTLAEISSTAVQQPHFGGSTLLSDYWALTKPEVNFLILITTVVGFYLASAGNGRFSFAGLFNVLLGSQRTLFSNERSSAASRWWRWESDFLREE